MAEIDQVAAYIPQGEYKKLSKEQWSLFKDSVFSINQKKADSIFKKYGFVGFDLVGKEGSNNFWVIVQHSDHTPLFQEKVLEKMKNEVDKQNADANNYALLVDRVEINKNKPQVYGSQVKYNWKICQAYPKNLIDSVNVNKRRLEIGLKPLESYLNEMSKLHFDINKDIFLSAGIKQPTLYKIK